MKLRLIVFSVLFFSSTVVFSQDRGTTFKALLQQSLLIEFKESDTIICGQQTDTDLAKMLAKENWKVNELIAIDCFVKKADQDKSNVQNGIYYYLGGIAYNDFDDKVSEQFFQKAYVDFNKNKDWEGMFFSLTQLFNAKANVANVSDETTARELSKLFDELEQVARKTNYPVVEISLKESQLRKAFKLNDTLTVPSLDEIAALAIKYTPTYPNRTRQLFTALGIVYQKIGESDKALRFKRKALQLADPKKRDYPSFFANIGAYYISTRELDSAKYYFSKAYHLIPKETNAIYLLDIKSNIAYNASVTFKTLREMDSAWYYSINSLQAKYKLTNLQVAQNSSYADKKFELQKRDLEMVQKNLEIENKKKEQIYLITALCVFALLIAFLLFYYKKTKKLQAEAEELVEKREKLLRILNHDLLAPLQVFSTTATLLPKLLSKQRFEEVAVVQNSLAHTITALQSTLNNLFNWDKRVNNKDNETLKIEKNLSKEILSIVALYESFGSNRSISIETQIVKDVNAPIFFTTFGNLVRNLIYNAVKHGLSNSTVFVEFKELDANTLLFSVQNKFSTSNLIEIEDLVKALTSKIKDNDSSEGLGINLILDAAEKLNGSITTELNEDVLTIRFVFPK